MTAGLRPLLDKPVEIVLPTHGEPDRPRGSRKRPRPSSVNRNAPEAVAGVKRAAERASGSRVGGANTPSSSLYDEPILLKSQCGRPVPLGRTGARPPKLRPPKLGVERTARRRLQRHRADGDLRVDATPARSASCRRRRTCCCCRRGVSCHRPRSPATAAPGDKQSLRHTPPAQQPSPTTRHAASPPVQPYARPPTNDQPRTKDARLARPRRIAPAPRGIWETAGLDSRLAQGRSTCTQS